MSPKTYKLHLELTRHILEDIEDYRYSNRLDKADEAVKELIKLGIDYRKEKVNRAISEALVENEIALKKLADK